MQQKNNKYSHIYIAVIETQSDQVRDRNIQCNINNLEIEQQFSDNKSKFVAKYNRNNHNYDIIKSKLK